MFCAVVQIERVRLRHVEEREVGQILFLVLEGLNVAARGEDTDWQTTAVGCHHALLVLLRELIRSFPCVLADYVDVRFPANAVLFAAELGKSAQKTISGRRLLAQAESHR